MQRLGAFCLAAHVLLAGGAMLRSGPQTSTLRSPLLLLLLFVLDCHIGVVIAVIVVIAMVVIVIEIWASNHYIEVPIALWLRSLRKWEIGKISASGLIFLV